MPFIGLIKYLFPFIEALALLAKEIQMQNEGVVLEGVQWASLKHFDDIEPITDEDFEVLSEIRDVLDKHEYLDRFGIALLHRHFEIQEDEFAIEYTDEQKRISEVRIEKREEATEKNSVQTMWRFTKEGANAVTRCVLRCNSSGSWSHQRYHNKEP